LGIYSFSAVEAKLEVEHAFVVVELLVEDNLVVLVGLFVVM
jgi:hypothetical protein